LKPAKSLPATTIGRKPFFELPVPLVGVDLTALFEPLKASVFLSSVPAVDSVLVEPFPSDEFEEEFLGNPLVVLEPVVEPLSADPLVVLDPELEPPPTVG
jgi:hypothetical protein